MKYVIRRYMDDGYGNTHLIEEYYTDDNNIIDTSIKLWEGEDPSLSEIEESCFHQCDNKQITDSINFNPNGYGNDIDEYRIFENENLIYTIGY